mmetsp:Transcript_2033/g.4280  ORF Transcript_2033/g.4280 Transcript_2033/m.4280 type:complete len:101 (+) Transcript_2033:138-440(+)
MRTHSLACLLAWIDDRNLDPSFFLTHNTAAAAAKQKSQKNRSRWGGGEVELLPVPPLSVFLLFVSVLFLLRTFDPLCVCQGCLPDCFSIRLSCMGWKRDN